MPTVICPHCQFFGNIPAHLAGRPIRCRQCNNAFNATPIQTQGPASMSQPVSAPAPAPAPSFEFDGENGGSVATAGAAREPWYYSYCYVATLILLGLDLAAVVLGVAAWIIFGLMVVADAPDVGRALSAYVMSSVFMGLWAVVIVVATLYWFAFVLIFIDAARHVRRIHAELARR
ncbi:MAG: hypothetical protein JNM56_32920 [Planctomycetia bacterium]|nr:hypothetical protein [Planctomycetia bacterium]